MEELLPAHTRLSASGAERWMNCAGSQTLAERLQITEEEYGSIYAEEGTAAHELGEKCLKTGTEAWEYLEEFVHIDHEVTEDMSNAVQMYLDYCRALMRMFPDAEARIEVRVDNKSLHPDFGGTSDFTLIGKTFIIVVDYKHGVGIAKDAKNNPQAMYYGLGTYHKLTTAQQALIRDVHIVIVQPRGFHPDGEIREWTIDRDDLVKWGVLELIPAMNAVDAPDAPLKAGEHCRFCPAKIGCPVMQAMAKAAFEAKVEDAHLYSNEDLGLEYERLAPVRMYLKAIQDESYARAKKGIKVPGGKMVRGKADRVLKDGGKEKAIAKWGDDAYADRKIKSPAQLSKLLGGQKFVSAEAYKPDGSLSFVPLDHKGMEVKIQSASDKFKGVKRANNS